MEINEAIKLLENASIMGVTVDKSPLPLAEAVRTVIDALKEQQPRVKEQWNMCIKEDEAAPKEAGWYRVIDANGNEYTDYFFAVPRVSKRGVSYWKDSDYPIIAWKHASQPTAAEASEIRTGRWVYYPRPHYFKCSKCRYTVPYKKAALHMGEREYAFCPHCGAKMDGDVQ